MVFSFSGVIPKAFHICSLASSQNLGFFSFYLILNVTAAIPLMICIHIPANPLYYRFGSFEGWRMVHLMFLPEGSNGFVLDVVGLMLREWLEQIVVLESFVLFTSSCFLIKIAIFLAMWRSSNYPGRFAIKGSTGCFWRIGS